MNYPKIVEEKLLGSYTSGGKIEWRLKPQPYRLEGIHFRLQGGVLGGTITAQSADRAFTTVKRIKVGINATTAEGTVKGTFWDVAGSSLVEAGFKNGICSSVNKFALQRDVATGTPGWFDTGYWLDFRLPYASDPGGYRTALPLDKLNEDLQISVEFDTVGNIATGATLTTAPNLYATFHYRDLLGEPAAFVLTEQKSEDVTWSGSGEQNWNIPQTGRLLNVLLQSYSDSNNRGMAQTSNSDRWQVYIGRQCRWDTTIRGLMLQNELQQQTEPRHIIGAGSTKASLFAASTSAGSPNYAMTEGNLPQDSSLMFDFLYDTPAADAFSLGSCPNLDPVRLNGQLAQIRGTAVTAGTLTRFTYQKLLGDPAKLIGSV